MNDKFDELAKGMAQSVTRRGALKKFGVGLAGIAMASLGLANKAEGVRPGQPGDGSCNHCRDPFCRDPNDQACLSRCVAKCFGKKGGG